MFFQAEDGIRDLVRSRGLGDVYKRQVVRRAPQVMVKVTGGGRSMAAIAAHFRYISKNGRLEICLLYTSDAADERSSVDLGGRRIIKKKKKATPSGYMRNNKTRLVKTTLRTDI